MTQQWSLPAWAVVAVGLALVLGVLLLLALLHAARREHRELRASGARTAAATESLTARVLELERGRGSSGATGGTDADVGYLITEVGDPARAEPVPAPALPAPLFADAVLRESVVQAASLAAGVRHALAPRTRHRIGFEMRREVTLARRRRRRAQRHARRGPAVAPEQGSTA